MKSIFPSLLAAGTHDIDKLGELMTLLSPWSAGYHLDIMDGKFVSTKTLGVDFVNALAQHTVKQCWIHAMIEKPLRFIENLVVPQGSIVSIHIEIKNEINQSLKKIREKKLIPSLAINPKTDVEELLHFLNSDISHVLVMSVEPGSSGQKFLENSTKKIETLANYRAQHGLCFKIGVDGGINQENIAHLAALGVDYCAVGSAIFNHADPLKALELLAQI